MNSREAGLESGRQTHVPLPRKTRLREQAESLGSGTTMPSPWTKEEKYLLVLARTRFCWVRLTPILLQMGQKAQEQAGCAEPG